MTSVPSIIRTAAAASAAVAALAAAAPASSAPGIVSTVAGNRQAQELYGPSAVAVAYDGAVLIADTRHNVIKRVKDGVSTVVAGNGVAGYSGDGGPATSASLNRPEGISVTDDGGFLIADTENHRVRKVSPQWSPTGVVTYVITGVAGNGQLNTGINGIPAIDSPLAFPTDVAAMPGGGFLIADKNNSVVREVGADGIIRPFAGNGQHGFTGDGPATGVAMNSPTNLAVGRDGAVFVVDSGNHRIRRVAAGEMTTVVGTGGVSYPGDGSPGAQVGVNGFAGLSATADGGFVYGDGNFVRRATPTGSGGFTVTTLVGNGVSGTSGDTLPARGDGQASTDPAPPDPYATTIHDAKDVAVTADGGYVWAEIGSGLVRGARVAAGSADEPPLPGAVVVPMGWGQWGDIPVPGRYTGGQQADLAVWRPSTGEWFARSHVTGKVVVRQNGQSGDVPVPGDYTGDGRTDFTVFRPQTGTWIVKAAPPDGYYLEAAPTQVQWGQAGDIPVRGDYDRDGRADYIVWRPGNATFYVRTNPVSRIGWLYLLPRTFSYQWGQAGDRPFLGVRANGPSSLAVWRPSTRQRWDVTPDDMGGYPPSAMNLLLPGSRFITGNFGPRCGSTSVGTVFGGVWRIEGRGFTGFAFDWEALDVPVPAPFMGSRSDDVAVWRPTTGTWHVLPQQFC